MSYAEALSLMRKGRSNPSDYQVILPVDVARFGISREINDYISFFTRSVTLPGENNSVLSVKGQENIGIGRNVITGRNYGSPVVMTVTDNSEMLAYRALKSWLNYSVFNSNQFRDRNLVSRYYNDIKTDIDIVKLEPRVDPIRNDGRNPFDLRSGHHPELVWRLYNCIPLSVEQTTLSVEAADSLLDFTVSIAYESFSVQSFEPNPVDRPEAFELSSFFNPNN